jgi:hypothetical protein
MSFGWWTILDTLGGTVEGEKTQQCCSSRATQTGAPGTYYYTRFKGTYIFCLARSPSEWHTYTVNFSIVSMLKNPSLACCLPFNYCTLIEVELTGDLNKGS